MYRSHGSRDAASVLPRIYLYSAGWSDYLDHREELLGFLFDIEDLGEDRDHSFGKWKHFGGTGGHFDDLLANDPGIAEVENMLKELLNHGLHPERFRLQYWKQLFYEYELRIPF